MALTRMFRRLTFAVAVILAAALVPVATQAQAADGPSAHAVTAQVAHDTHVAETQTLTGSITGGDTVQTDRIFRDGHEHGCETPTPMPSTVVASSVHADVHNLVNTHGEARCIIVEGDFSGCGGSQTQVNAYSSYSPATPLNNVIGASGFSTIAKVTFGFRVAANTPYTLVVHEVTNNAGCPAYSVKVTNAPLAATITQAQGADPASITPAVTSFRTSLGSPSAQREITWDDVPEGNADPANLPLDYYNTTSPQGLVITAPAQVKVSSNGSGAPAEFASLNAGNTARYQPFSGIRMFSPITPGVTQAEIAFRSAGTATAAPTSAFGAVLVSPGTSAYLVPRDADGNPIGIYVPPAQVNGLGFYGLSYPTVQIYSMSLMGDVVQGATLGTVFDNFIYADPGGQPLTVTATGPGKVSGLGIQCPGDCTELYKPGGQVTLTAAPSVGSGFAGWGGSCSGTAGKVCTLTMSEARTATATFRDCSTQKAAVGAQETKLAKAKKAVKKAKKAVKNANTPAAVDKAKAKLKKAKAKLKKAKKALAQAQGALTQCLS